MLPKKSLLIAVIVSLGMPLILLASSATTPQLQPPKLISNTQKKNVASQPKRIALVIGNTNYQGRNKLNNPGHDADDMTGTLRNLGFEVIEVLNANKKEMYDALTEFHHKLCQGCVGLFYYSGHGVSVNGENYLIPIDAHLETPLDVNDETLPVHKVQYVMEDAQTDVNLIILDACRDNPFSKRWHSRGLYDERGGIVVWSTSKEPPKKSGFFIVFATSPDSYALDGSGRNGTFTSYLLKYINTPNLPIEQLFKQVRIDVEKETQGTQIPWDSSSLVGDFSLNPTANPVNPVPFPVPTPTPSLVSPVPSPIPVPSLVSPVPSQYVKLRDLLAAQNWKDADTETSNVMLKVAGRTSQGWLDDIKNFPCADLQTIDSLWKQYSNGRFGFSVQKQIWLEVGGIFRGGGGFDTENKFGDRVGWYLGNNNWINYSEIKFSLQAPSGHLPVRGVIRIISGFGSEGFGESPEFGMRDLFSRVESCHF